MVNIDSSYFGNIIVDGKKFDHDVALDWKGGIQKRPGSHQITRRDIQDLLLKDPEVIIIGTGTAGMMKVDPSAEVEARMSNIDLIVKITPDAIKEFNKHAKRRKAVAIMHVTC
jgi:hypothetical protein